MRRILLLPLICLIFGSALTAPVSKESEAVIENYENNIDENGNYNFSFKTSNGIKRSENGNVINTGSEEYIAVQGEYSYVDTNGEFVVIRYYADDTGFHILPQGAEIPPTGFPPIMTVSGGLNPNVVASLLGG